MKTNLRNIKLSKARITSAVLRLLAKAGGFTACVWLILYLTIQLPVVQTRLVQYVSEELTKLSGFPTTVESVNINWFDLLVLEGVTIKDHKDEQFIEVSALAVDWRFSMLLDDDHIAIDGVYLNNPSLTLTYDSVSNLSNMDEWLYSFNGKPDSTYIQTTEEDNSHPKFVIEEISIHNGHFSSHFEGTPHEPKGVFDHNHIVIDSIHANVTHFNVMEYTTTIHVNNLHAVDRNSGLTLQNLNTDFQINDTSMVFTPLTAKIGNKTFINVTDQLIFSYDNYDDFSFFNDSVWMSATLDRSTFNTHDLAKFAPDLYEYDDTYTISGVFNGTVNDFALKKGNIKLGKNSDLNGIFKFKDATDPENMYMDIDFKKGSKFYPSDLYQYTPNDIHSTLATIGKSSLDLKFKGTPFSFHILGDFNSEAGYIFSDFSLDINKEVYKGKLYVEELAIGHLSNNPDILQKTSGHLTFDGQGFTLENINLIGDIELDKVGILGYDYQNVKFKKIEWNSERNKFLFQIQDPNITLLSSTNIAFKEEQWYANIFLKAPDLSKLGLIDSPYGIQAVLHSDFEGITLDKMVGEARCLEASIIKGEKNASIKNLVLNLDKNRSERTVQITSDRLSFLAKGNFKIQDVIEEGYKFGTDFIKHAIIKKQIDTDTSSIQNSMPVLNSKTQSDLTYNLKINKVNDIIQLFDEGITVAPSTEVNGLYHFGKKEKFEFHLSTDSLFLQDIHILNNRSSLVLERHLQDSTLLLLDLTTHTDNIHLSDIDWQNLNIDVHKKDSVFQLITDVSHANTGDNIHLQSSTLLYEDSVVVNIPKTSFSLKGSKWENAHNRRNRIIISKEKEIEFQDVGFASNKQLLALSGFISDSTYKELTVNVKDLELGFLSNILETEVAGKLSIEAGFKNLYQSPQMDGDIVADSLFIEEYFVGRIDGSSKWSGEKQKFDIESSLTRDKNKALIVKGSYQPSAIEGQQLDMSLIFDGAQLKLIEYFTAESISNVEGNIIGFVQIKGSPSAPKLWGDAFMTESQLKLNYTNTTYRFNDKIYIRPHGIYAKRLKLIDEYEHYCYLNGGLYFKDFKDFRLDLTADMENFQGLNTTQKDNESFYGTFFGTGQVKVLGTLEDIVLNIQGKTEKNTKLYIPITEEGTVEDQSYVRYFDSNPDSSEINNSLANKIEEEIESEINITTNLDLELTPDAYCEMIFDKKSGDIIRGNAEGKLQMTIDPSGDFSMFGKADIVEGAYNFTMRLADFNLLDKRFDIMPNSSIIWNGSPYGANLNITAAYEQKASIAPLITEEDSTILEAPEIKRYYPIKVLLDMKGDMTAPIFSFDIDISNYPSTITTETGTIPMEGYIAAFKQRLLNDEQELNRQVFSLIVLKKLAAENNFGGFSQSAGSSVTELFTNQLSYLLSQLDENFEINVDLNGLDQEAIKALQLRFSYTFWQGRVRISRDGGVTNRQNKADAASILGDWTVEVALTPKGNFRAKFYQKHNNELYSEFETNTTTGASFMHTKSFNSIKDLFGGKQKKQGKKSVRKKIREMKKKAAKEKKKTKELKEDKKHLEASKTGKLSE